MKNLIVPRDQKRICNVVKSIHGLKHKSVIAETETKSAHFPVYTFCLAPIIRTMF